MAGAAIRTSNCLIYTTIYPVSFGWFCLVAETGRQKVKRANASHSTCAGKLGSDPTYWEIHLVELCFEYLPRYWNSSVWCCLFPFQHEGWHGRPGDSYPFNNTPEPPLDA
ncbi:unnamed protein product [Cylindrotheca closterium]|uniref:Uncharacterized protein n=1 Tax=Cylindrotheca closterium TaxID=2856 RepID=A0AAD2CMN3_9STRA|nr:unnamed protein product [Cylindrotheca closterium]